MNAQQKANKLADKELTTFNRAIGDLQKENKEKAMPDTPISKDNEVEFLEKDYHNWQEALKLQGNGWRLPNIYELIDLGWKGCWSSSPCAGLATFAWFAYFSNGDSNIYSKSSYFYVRLIRGEPSEQAPVSREEVNYYLKHKRKMPSNEI